MSPDDIVLTTVAPAATKKKPRKRNNKKKKAVKCPDDVISAAATKLTVDDTDLPPTEETLLPSPRLFEIKRTGDDRKGLGLFATEDIPRGTRLLAEPVVWRVDVDGESCSEADALAIWEQIPALAQAQLLTLAKHYTPRGGILKTVSELRILDYSAKREQIIRHRDLSGPRIREVTHDGDESDPESDTASEDNDAGAAGSDDDDERRAALATLAHLIAAEHRNLEQIDAIAILQMNHFVLTDTAPSSPVKFLGVCPTASRMNNACIPNAAHIYHSTMKALVVHAIHPIAKGEEITIGYAPPLNGAERRKEVFARTGFVCDCLCCKESAEGKKLEKRRERMVECAAYMQYWMREGMEENVEVEGRIVLDGKEVLRRGNELIRMLGEDGLMGSVYVQARMQQAHIAARCGSRKQAIMHAEKAIEEARISVGEDHPEFRNNWVEAEVLKRKMKGLGVVKKGKKATEGTKESAAKD